MGATFESFLRSKPMPNAAQTHTETTAAAQEVSSKSQETLASTIDLPSPSLSGKSSSEKNGQAKTSFEKTSFDKSSMKKGNEQKDQLRTWGRRLGLVCLGGCISFALGCVLCTVLAVYWAAPDLSKFQLRSNTLYDAQGQLIYEMMTPDDYHRILTSAEQVDHLYLKMLLSSEDERFWEHYGVDPWSVARAAVGNILAGRRISGASTLAMQVCRLLEPKERTFLNKFREALGALYLTHKYGREQILTMYLTLAPFGGNIEGVTAASFSYFGHSPARLTPAEAALLVALPRSPEKIRPDKHHAAALYYRNEVLTKAVTDGVIQHDILESATRESVPQYTRALPESAVHLGQSLFAGKLHPLLSDLLNQDQAAATPMDAEYQPWFEDKSQVNDKRPGQDTPQINQANARPSDASQSYAAQNNVEHTDDSRPYDSQTLKPVNSFDSRQMPADYALRISLRFDQFGRRLPTEVYTTIDSQVQATLLEVIDGYRQNALFNLPQENVAMLAVDNQTFEVLGYACSEHSYVDVIQAPRSPGSALKPFAYAMAFEQGLVHPNSILLDLGKIYRTYQPRNYDRMFFGEITAAQALQGSLNLPALEIMRAVGPVNFVDHLNSYPNTITNRYLFTPQVESIKEAPTQDGVLKDNAAQTASANSELTPFAAYRQQLSTKPEDYIRGRIKLMSDTTPHLGIILGACGISLYDLTQLYAALAHDGQITPLQLLALPQAPGLTNLSARTGSDSHSSDTNSVNNGDTNIATKANQNANQPDSSLNTHLALAPTKTGAHLLSKEQPNFTTLFNPDTARVTYNLLEGLPAPKGFNFDRKIKISYKTGTSFKYRDAIAVGSRGRYTIGVWQGRTDGNPSAFALSAYEKSAPLLFRALTLLPDAPVFKPQLPNSGLLNSQPPQALEHLEIRTLGLTALRRTNELEKTQGFTQGLPLEIAYPSDGMQIYVTSRRILLQIQGGKPPYYVLINDQPQTEQSYFEPTHNGIYTITAIDSTGASQAIQVWVKGIEPDSSTLPEPSSHSEPWTVHR